MTTSRAFQEQFDDIGKEIANDQKPGKKDEEGAGQIHVLLEKGSEIERAGRGQAENHRDDGCARNNLRKTGAQNHD